MLCSKHNRTRKRCKYTHTVGKADVVSTIVALCNSAKNPAYVGLYKFSHRNELQLTCHNITVYRLNTSKSRTRSATRLGGEETVKCQN